MTITESINPIIIEQVPIPQVVEEEEFIYDEEDTFDLLVEAMRQSHIPNVQIILHRIGYINHMPCLNCLAYGWGNEHFGRCTNCVDTPHEDFTDDVLRMGTWTWCQDEYKLENDTGLFYCVDGFDEEGNLTGE